MAKSTLHSGGPKFLLLALIPKLCEQTSTEFKGRRYRRTQLQRSSFASTSWVDESLRCASLACQLAVAATKTNFRRLYLGVVAGCIALCGTFNTCRSCCFDNRVCPQNGTGLLCSLRRLPLELCPWIFEAPSTTCSHSLFDLTLHRVSL